MADLIILPPGEGHGLKYNLPDEPRQMVEMLIAQHGDIQQFVQFFSADPAIQQHIIYRAEMLIKGDELLYQEWNDAIKSHHLSRLRIIQVKALDVIEDTLDAEGELKGATAKTNTAKLVLGELFAGQIRMARSAVPIERITVGDTENTDDEDDASYQRAINA